MLAVPNEVALGVASVGVVVGVLARTWWVVPAGAAVWPVWFTGLNSGWWGHGVGEGWERNLASLTVLSVAGAAIGVVLVRWLHPPARRDPPAWRKQGRN